MFFNSRKKKARDTALMIEYAFRVHFSLTNHISPSGKFHPPEGFYLDLYILGYAIALAESFMMHTHRLGNAASVQKSRFLLEVIAELSISPREVQVIQSKLLKEWHIIQTTEDYIQGFDHALAVFGLTYGLTSPTNPLPLIKDSYAEADKFVAAGLAPDRKSGQILALVDGTLGRHIRGNYLCSS